jgi:hypothetical protein
MIFIYRSGPPYQRPKTSASNLANNYYYQRDVRRNPPPDTTLLLPLKTIEKGETASSYDPNHKTIAPMTSSSSTLPPQPGTPVSIKDLLIQ